MSQATGQGGAGRGGYGGSSSGSGGGRGGGYGGSGAHGGGNTSGMSGVGGGWTGGGHGVGGGEPGRGGGNHASNSGGPGQSGNSNTGSSSSGSDGGAGNAASSASSQTDAQAGRRSNSFSGFMSSAWSGLKGFTANLANDVGGFFGYGQDSVSPSSAGFNNVSAMNHHVNKEHDKGKSLANRDQIGKVVSSITPKTKAAVNLGTFLGYQTLSPEAQRAYSYANDKGLKSSTKKGISVGLSYAGVPANISSAFTEVASLGMMQDDEASTGRRNTAQQSFTGNTGRVGGNGQLTNPTNTVAAAPSRHSFSAPSYGFGDYNSHLEGLLS